MPSVIALVDDLMFLSRIREAARGSGVEVQGARGVAELLGPTAPVPDLVVVDLDGGRNDGLSALRALRAAPRLAAVPVIGFLNHEEAERSRQAREAGCTRVLARGAFVREIGGLLRELAAERRPED